MKLFLVFFTLFYATTLFGAYEVKIAVYKNAKNLHAAIAKISKAKYRNSIKVEKKHNLYYAHAILASNKEAANALHDYKKVFQDAFIADKQVALPQPKPAHKTVQPVAPKVKETKPLPLLNAQALLEDKTVYLCYENGPAHLKDRLVKMVFKAGEVTYDPMKKMSKPVEMPCAFKKNALTLQLSDMKITHQLTEKRPNYLLAKSTIDGVVVNRLRYYFDKDAALAFVTGH